MEFTSGTPGNNIGIVSYIISWCATHKFHLDPWLLSSMTFLYFQAVSPDYCNVECLILHLGNNIGIV